ncbi:MAG: hypothetical protein WCO63_03790 [Bacteroidota bacterium]
MTISIIYTTGGARKGGRKQISGLNDEAGKSKVMMTLLATIDKC